MQIGNFQIDLIVVIIGSVYTITTLIQLYFYLGIYSKILKKPKKKPKSSFEPVSVIICAQNEEHNLRDFLPSVLSQDYPDYEVIVVDDCSTDDTADVLSELKAKFPRLRVTFINKDEKFSHGKKLALTIGIKAAKNELLLLTDADCKPISDKWIMRMCSKFNQKTSIVLGFGGYMRKRSLLNNLIRFDTMFIALQYLTMAIKGFPYMGVGRNLAYKKTLFFNNKGFARHYHILSGDDDIFINEVAKKTNTSVEFSPESIVLSVPQRRISGWFKQKIRHFQTSSYYNFKTKFILAFEVLSRVLFYMSFIVLLFLSKELNTIILSIFLARFISQLIIYKYAIVRLKQKNLLLTSFIYDFILPFFNFIFIAVNLFSSDKKRWKK